MNNNQILSLLQSFRTSSGACLPPSVVHGFSDIMGKKGEYYSAFLAQEQNVYGDYVWKLTDDTDITNKSKVTQLYTVGAGYPNTTQNLVSALKGGTKYPVLNAALGATLGLVLIASGAGTVAFAAGVMWGATGAAIAKGTHISDFLPRNGDVIVFVQRLGKMRDASAKMVVVYSRAYLLVDPFRMKAKFPDFGWLLHEQRHVLSLPSA